MDDVYFYYDKHYITIDESGRITDGWSTGPHPEKSTDGAILLTDNGGYQFRLIIDGKPTEENPTLQTIEGVPLYKWVDEAVVARTEEEIQADIDLIPLPPPSPIEQLRADVDFIAALTDCML